MVRYMTIFTSLFACAFLLVSFQSVEAENAAPKSAAVEGQVPEAAQETAPTTDTEKHNAIDDIRFLETNWMPKLLLIIDNGPVLLDRETPEGTEVFYIKPPPLNSSQQTKDEIVYLHEIAKTERTPDAIKRILYENSGISAHSMFVNEGLIDEQNYKTLSLMEIIDNDNMFFILERKKYFERPRPSELDPTLKTVIDNPPHAAYPSGHATQTYINALVLADFDPENADVYKQFAIDVAHRREIAGVHYPSDSEAGRGLAADVLARLRTIPIFEKKYQAAKLSYIKPDLSGKNLEKADDMTTDETPEKSTY